MLTTIFRDIDESGSYIPRLIIFQMTNCKNSFFAHLVEVLGPSEYLSAVCLLLADKMSNRVVRQNSEDMVASFSLPLSLLARFDANVQLGVRSVVAFLPLFTNGLAGLC